MTEQTTTHPHEDSFILEPHILVRVVEDEEATEVQCAALGEDEEKALLVFPTAEEAARFQRATGQCTPEEGFHIVSDRVSGGAMIVARTLQKGCFKWVAVPEPWSGDGAIARFAAEEFLALLDERTVTVEE